MTDPRLSRPDPAPDAGPLDATFYDLVEARIVRLLETDPTLGTWLGIHDRDGELGDASRDAVLGDLEAERAHLSKVEALDPAGLSNEVRFERDIELHNLRLAIYETQAVRRWERRSTALDSLGDALFLLFARDFAPLSERLDAIASRLEAAPAYLADHRTRPEGPQVRAWQQLEISTAERLPSFLAEIEAAGEAALPADANARLRTAIETADAAIVDYADWLHESLAAGTDDWSLGRDMHDELVALRAFDGLDADAILEIGWSQLAENKLARAAAAREIDPDADEATVVGRVKDDHPDTFAEALEGYRDAMARARAHLVERDLISLPEGEAIEVIETPGYLRNVIPFAAYFSPPKFGPAAGGIYVVTPSVDGEAGAMREHYRASISNTSIHEAYPGHHLQLSAARLHPSLTRVLTHAPEFIEGWGMYTEQMMREEGFDDGPAFQVALLTDAIWRACRIVLDVRMHRGELTTDEATDFLVEHTGFERPNAAAEVRRYTYTPTYPLSYLLGKVLILELRDDERRRLGNTFSLKAFHDALMRNGSLPISFHRRALAASRA